MSSNKIIIACDGKEISYGFSFLHLFQYKSETEKFNSEMIDDLSIEIYSVAAFRHANISKKTIKVFVGEVQNVDSSYTEIFNKYGMTIYQSEFSFVLKADDKRLTGHMYEEFIKYANAKRKEYYALEKQYIDRVEELDPYWIAKEFKQLPSEGLFGRKSTKVQQQYDCLAFVMYMIFQKGEDK